MSSPSTRAFTSPIAVATLGHWLPQAQSIKQWVVDLRRTIHQHPELMYEEYETSKLVQKTLRELGIPFQAPIAETGVLATVSNGDGPCVALRADMDALPIHEEADVEFRSKIDGKMHACGHDCHTAMLLGAAKLLKEHESEINGTVKLIFQPAEEGGAGAKLMREAGVLKDPDVQRIFGLHVWHLAKTGSITSCAGTFLAATTNMEITIRGVGGHAAVPHYARDPVVTSAKIIN
ncbi:MAG: M20 metallopeptidase family protein, partial [Pirellulaceae bacterium]